MEKSKFDLWRKETKFVGKRDMNLNDIQTKKKIIEVKIILKFNEEKEIYHEMITNCQNMNKKGKEYHCWTQIVNGDIRLWLITTIIVGNCPK